MNLLKNTETWVPLASHQVPRKLYDQQTPAVNQSMKR